MRYRVVALDHVQLAMPAGHEARARAFYQGILGLGEQPKPPVLAARGGCWFSNGEVALHLGVDGDFRPARKAHPALVVEGLDALCGVARDRPVTPWRSTTRSPGSVVATWTTRSGIASS